MRVQLLAQTVLCIGGRCNDISCSPGLLRGIQTIGGGTLPFIWYGYSRHVLLAIGLGVVNATSPQRPSEESHHRLAILG